jgi:hypothetical protein
VLSVTGESCNVLASLIISVEEWRPGDSRIVCPRCGFEGLPMVRRQRNKVCKSKCLAACMLGYDSYIIYNLFNMAFGGWYSHSPADTENYEMDISPE